MLYFFVGYGINARGAFSSQEEAQEMATRMEPIKINGTTVYPEVVPMEASLYEGVVSAVKWNAQAPLGSIILYENEKLKD
jgi:hypothetical protein